MLRWYAANARDLPWRALDCSPWGIVVCEVMSQQTPVARVEGPWRRWLERWPTPAALAADSPGEAIRMWDRLGYPRRAVRLHQLATVLVERFDGEVPRDEATLLTLPGVGAYTAAAVASFAFGEPATVIDTNVRRVLVRALAGAAQAAPSLTAAERDLAVSATPRQRHTAAAWNAAVMELGALVCTARAPRCGECPVADRCAWLAAGRPEPTGPGRRAQGYEGTDRQVRGRILAVLRAHDLPQTRAAFASADPDPARVDRCLAGLIEDGLVEPVGPLPEGDTAGQDTAGRDTAGQNDAGQDADDGHAAYRLPG